MAGWRRALRSLVDSGEFRTQQQLVRALDRAGHSVSQGTVSRELGRLGVRKTEGVYRLGTSSAPAAPVLRASLAHGGGLLVLQTLPAHASVLAQQVDDAELDGVLGTIAGDDTVFVALASQEASEGLLETLGVPRPQES